MYDASAETEKKKADGVIRNRIACGLSILSSSSLSTQDNNLHSYLGWRPWLIMYESQIAENIKKWNTSAWTRCPLIQSLKYGHVASSPDKNFVATPLDGQRFRWRPALSKCRQGAIRPSLRILPPLKKVTYSMNPKKMSANGVFAVLGLRL